jgi:cbb3-type cytochrome oxidase subunit 3
MYNEELINLCVLSATGFMQNITIYMTLIVITTMYIIMLVWARKKDKKDVEQLGVIPLPDNEPEHKVNPYLADTNRSLK